MMVEDVEEYSAISGGQLAEKVGPVLLNLNNNLSTIQSFIFFCTIAVTLVI